ATSGAAGGGWGRAGLEQIVPNGDGRVLPTDGDGTTLLFQPPATPGGPYVAPAGDFSTLVRLADGTFRRTLKDQTVYQFNAQNQLASIRDRNGNETQFFYDAGGRLTTIQDPVGLQTIFTYTGNHVTGITDPAQRTTTLQYDAAGNLAAVIDPDQSQRQWRYDGSHRMTLEIDKRGNADQDFYDFASRADHSLRADRSVARVSPVAVQGLFPADQTTDRDNAPLAGPPSEAGIEIADPNGHITRQTLDQRGQVLSTSDEIGPQGSVVRDANGFI